MGTTDLLENIRRLVCVVEIVQTGEQNKPDKATVREAAHKRAAA